MAAETIHDLVLGYIHDQEIEATAAYVERGRAYAALTEDELKQRWAAAFKVWADSGESQPMEDFGSELALRGVELPMELVEAEWAVLQAKIDAAGPPDAEAEAAIAERVTDYARRRDRSSH